MSHGRQIMGGRSLFWGLVFCLLPLLFPSFLQAKPEGKKPEIRSAEATKADEGFRKQKAQLLIQKGQKAQAAGKIEEAVEAFEDAYEAYPGNVQALLLWGDILCTVGMYQRAFGILDKIPMSSLPPNGQAQVSLLKGKIALASGSLTIASVFLNDAVKASPQFGIARVRLALLHLCLGGHQRSRELADGLNSLEGLPYRERAIALLLDLGLDNFSRAFENAQEMAGAISRYEDEDGAGFLKALWGVPLFLAGSWFPLAGSSLVFSFYFLFLLGGLSFLASRITDPAPLWHSIGFIMLALVHVLVARGMLQGELWMAILREGFDPSASGWIIPQVTHAIHLLSLALYLIFPMFLFLPSSSRPRRYELFSIWFFCFWFMTTVAVFQARLVFSFQLPCMAACLIPTAGAAFMMPLGKYLLFLMSSRLGLGATFEKTAAGTGSGALGFTECKILETKALNLLEKEQFGEVVSIARKAFAAQPRKNLVPLWIAQIKALIELEEIFDAEKSLRDFQAAFPPQPSGEVGQLLNAYLKMHTADFAGALNVLNSVSEQQAKRFSPEQASWSLRVLGQCYLNMKDMVQAHVELSKAFEAARTPLSRISPLCDLMELEVTMERQEWAGKWSLQAASIQGGIKTTSLGKVIQSMLAFSQKDMSGAMKLAFEACHAGVKNGRAWRWLAHLKILNGDSGEAEKIMEANLTAGSAEALFLMQELTGQKKG